MNALKAELWTVKGWEGGLAPAQDRHSTSGGKPPFPTSNCSKFKLAGLLTALNKLLRFVEPAFIGSILIRRSRFDGFNASLH
jgi:hypothetical protein